MSKKTAITDNNISKQPDFVSRISGFDDKDSNNSNLIKIRNDLSVRQEGNQ